MNSVVNLKAGVQDHRSNSVATVGLLYLGLLHLWNTLLCVLLIIAALLRETPEFWRNTGGYPVLLRESVHWFFFPGFVVCLLGVFSGAWVSFKLPPRYGAGVGLALAVTALQLLALVAVVIVVLWNNLSNLLYGEPMHHHPT